MKHVYNNSTSDENPEFWRKFYDRVNQTYRTNHSEDIFMVGENLSWAGDCAPYYKGLPSLFNFSFWWDLRNVLNNENAFVEGKKFGARLSEIRGWFEGVRPGKWVDSIKLSNHDEDRTASSLGKFTPKIGLAACFLLTSGGKPARNSATGAQRATGMNLSAPRSCGRPTEPVWPGPASTTRWMPQC